MHYHRRKGWEIATSEMTPEHLLFSRRALLTGGAAVPGIRPGPFLHALP